MKDISRGDTIPRTLYIFLFLKLCTRVTTETYTMVGLSKTVRCRKISAGVTLFVLENNLGNATDFFFPRFEISRRSVQEIYTAAN
jgi:hypothetical protein